MRGRGAGVRTGLCALVLASALAACGAGSSADDAADVVPTSPATPATPATATPAPSTPAESGGEAAAPGAEAPGLAELAEQLADDEDRSADETVLGGDISWPQCPPGLGIPQKRSLGMPMPLPEAEYVVVGLTNGPGFHPNPCLADQVAWVRDRGLLISAYAVASFPDDATLARHGGDGPFDAGTTTGRLENTGYQQALFNLASMEASGFVSPIVWIDVEPVPDFEWSGDEDANAAVVRGLARGYTDAGLQIGVYSTPYLWTQVVGDLELGIPEWRAAGHTSRDEALERCGPRWSIQGGTPVLAQWVADERDQNVTCPGVAGDLDRWFHRY